MAGENGETRTGSGEDRDKLVFTEADVEKAIGEAETRELENDSESNLVFPYTEVKNIVEVERDPVYKVALREWDRKEAYLGNRVDRREKASADLVNQIFNIVGFFSVFQGVVLTAVSQLKSDVYATCGIIWWPILLSIVAGVVAIIGVSIKFSNLKELEESIHTEKTAQKDAARRATRLRGEGKQFFRFYLHAKERDRVEPIRSFHIARFLVILALVVFTVLFIFSYFAILCNTFAVSAWKGGINWP